ncbi:hypothetical protein Ancab_036975 [Ancistrocladus abbreviatus]
MDGVWHQQRRRRSGRHRHPRCRLHIWDLIQFNSSSGLELDRSRAYKLHLNCGIDGDDDDSLLVCVVADCWVVEWQLDDSELPRCTAIFRMKWASLQHQLLRKPEGNEAILAFQAGGLQGVIGGANFLSSASGSVQLPQQSRKFFDFAQQHGAPHIRDEVQLRGS